jgi:hypothetical protein
MLAVRATALLAIVLAVAFASGSAKADEPVAFAPSGSWTASFADESCSLERTFVHGDDTVHLRLRQYTPGRTVEVTLASETLDTRRSRSIRFAAGDHSERVEMYLPFESADGLEGLVFSAALAGQNTPGQIGSDYAVYAAGSGIEGLTISGAFTNDLEILTGSLEQPLKVMESCLDDLLTGWGLDAQAHRTLSRRAEPDWNERWLSVTAKMQRDFLRDKGSTRQDVRLILDQQGRPTACRVLQWPEDEPIAVRLCDALLREARIPPALDKDSKPVSSYFVLVLSAIARMEFSGF